MAVVSICVMYVVMRSSVMIDLHRLGLVHTDLKPENILLEDSTSATVPDESMPTSVCIHGDVCIMLASFSWSRLEGAYRHSHQIM